MLLVFTSIRMCFYWKKNKSCHTDECVQSQRKNIAVVMLLVLPPIMNGIVRQNEDTVVPHLTGAQTLLYPAHTGQIVIFREGHLR